MALAELISRLERDAEARLAAIRAAADAEITALDSASAGDAAARQRAELDQLRDERAGAHARALAVVRARSRADLRRAEAALLDRVFTRAAALAEEVEQDPGFHDAMVRDAEAALRYLEGLSVEVRCRPALAGHLARSLAGRAEIVSDPTSPPGFSMAATDGSVHVDNALTARLDRMRPSLAILLLAEVRR